MTDMQRPEIIPQGHIENLCLGLEVDTVDKLLDPQA